MVPRLINNRENNKIDTDSVKIFLLNTGIAAYEERILSYKYGINMIRHGLINLQFTLGSTMMKTKSKINFFVAVISFFVFLSSFIYGQSTIKVNNNILKQTGQQQISFQRIAIENSASNITGIYSDDLDGNGFKDIVVCERLNNKISLWLNNGGRDLSWKKVEVDNNYYRPLYLIIKDINGDGRKDILASSSEGNTLALWKNEGGDLSKWSRQIIDSSLVGAHAIDAADFNSDGKVDVVATSVGSNSLYWWQNDGGNSIHWQKRIVDSLFTTPQTCRAVDLDKNGVVDIVAAASTKNEIAWWQNKGGDPVIWEKFLIADQNDGVDFPHWIEAVDMDKDGYLDVVGAMYAKGEIAWWKNAKGNKNHWSKNIIVPNFLGVLTIQCADIDNDSFVDVVGTSTYLKNISWWQNNGNNTSPWKENTIETAYKGTWPLFISDLDNDGDMDIISGADVPIGNPPLSWWKNMLIVSGVENEQKDIPVKELKILNNFPNPFNPGTTITFELPVNSFVILKVFDVTGREITTLIKGYEKAGSHSVFFDAKELSSGIYFYKVQTGSSYQLGKMLLCK